MRGACVCGDHVGHTWASDPYPKLGLRSSYTKTTPPGTPIPTFMPGVPGVPSLPSIPGGPYSGRVGGRQSGERPRSGHPPLKWLWDANWGRAACGGNPYLPGIRSKVNDREMGQPFWCLRGLEVSLSPFCISSLHLSTQKRGHFLKSQSQSTPARERASLFSRVWV